MTSAVRRLAVAAVLMAAACTFAAAALAHGRLVIEGAADLRGGLSRSGDRLILPVGTHAVHPRPGAAGPLVRGVVREEGRIVIDLAHDAPVRTFVAGRALVIDVFQAQPGAHVVDTSVPAEVAGLGAPPSVPVSDARALVPGLPDSFAARIVGLHPAAAGSPLVAAAVPGGPRGTAAGRSDAAASGASSADAGCLLLPFARHAGVAIYRRPPDTIVVVDAAGASGDLPGGGAWWSAHRPRVTTTGTATLLRIPIAAAEGIRIERREEGLCLAGTPRVAAADAISYRASARAVSFAVVRPGRVVTVADPSTGALLLVGTDRAESGGLRPARRSATFALDETLAGIVVQPFSDRLALRSTAAGFDLVSDDGLPIHVPQDFANIAVASLDGLTRTLELGDAPVATLVRRLREKARAAALAPIRGRRDRRLDLAEAELGLGLGVEASGVLAAASADDPAVGGLSRAVLLREIARRIGGRGDPRELLADPAFPDTEEGRLWRALAWQPPAPVAPTQATLRRGLPLLLSYPEPLRAQGARIAADILLAGDDPDGLRAIDLLPRTEATRLASAQAALRLGHPEAALAAFETLARSRDPRSASEALRAGIRLKRVLGKLTAAAAADVLEAHRLDWRLIGEEGGALLEEADDRVLAGDLHRAFALWREAATHPESAAQAARRQTETLSRMADPSDAAAVPAADYASIMAENAARLDADHALATRAGLVLAGKLEALDLDDTAASIFAAIAAGMSPGPARAAIDVRLAEIASMRGDTKGAEAALGRDSGDTLPPELLARQRCVRASLLAAGGHLVDATAMLAAAEDDAGLDLRAKLLTQAGEWHAAAGTLRTLFERLPKSGNLDAIQGAIAIRLAAARLRDNDAASAAGVLHDVAGRLTDPDERRSLDALRVPLSVATAQKTPASANGI